MIKKKGRLGADREAAAVRLAEEMRRLRPSPLLWPRLPDSSLKGRAQATMQSAPRRCGASQAEAAHGRASHESSQPVSNSTGPAEDAADVGAGGECWVCLDSAPVSGHLPMPTGCACRGPNANLKACAVAHVRLSGNVFGTLTEQAIDATPSPMLHGQAADRARAEVCAPLQPRLPGDFPGSPQVLANA